MTDPNGDLPVTIPTLAASRRFRFATLAAATFAILVGPVSSRAQVCGDVTADNKVTATDAQKVLRTAVGLPTDLICTDQCAALETRIAALEKVLENVTVDGDNLVLTNMNFQVVSGSGSTDGTVTGTGNIFLGYNETNSSKEKHTGSHNLVIGRYHSYSSYGGVVAGEDNAISGISASVLGGALNLASASGAVVVAGEKNWAGGTSSVVLAGESNKASALACSVESGSGNLCSGRSSTVSGGSSNICSGQGSVLAGGSSRTLNSPLALMLAAAGTYF